MTRVPDRARHGLNVEFEILASLLEVLQRPARVRAQSLAVDEAVTTLSAAILNFAAEVDLTHFTLQAALHKASLLEALATTAHRTATATATVQSAGGLDRLSRLNQALLAVTADASVRKADLARKMDLHRQEIDRLLDLNHATSIAKLEKAFAALGKTLDIAVADAQ